MPVILREVKNSRYLLGGKSGRDPPGSNIARGVADGCHIRERQDKSSPTATSSTARVGTLT